ncbi:MAG: DNA-formamidopyrimidine glycosylase [bacterium]
MPELPEVETICRGLRRTVLNKKITGAEILRAQIIKPPSSPSELSREITGLSISGVERRAKYIKLLLNNGGLLLCHLRMTGRFLYFADKGETGRHTRIVFRFSGGDSLHYHDLRALGVWKLYNPDSRVPELEKLGVEPHSPDFTPAYLKAQAVKSGRPVRDWLLDQTVVAGIGNIYASEILFRSLVHPLSPANSLTGCQIEFLHREIVQVLKEAIKCCGTTFSDYMRVEGESGGFQRFLRVYKKEGEPCPNCAIPIERNKFSGRSVFFCPVCQS